MKSLTARFMLWNGGFVLLILLGFGLAIFLASQRTVEGMVDRDLVRRALQVARESARPEPPFGIGEPPPNPPPGEPEVQRPRIFNFDGTPRQLDGKQEMWSRKLFDESLRGKVILGTQWLDGRELRVVSAPIPGRDRAIGVVQIGQGMAPFRLAQRAQLWALGVAIPLSLLVSGLLGYLLARLVLRPVRSLTALAENIAANPLREEHMRADQPDEIGRLAGAFNSMTARLQSSNRDLSESLERQRQFTSDAAHEFRTPLTGIALAAENALDERATPAEMKRSLLTIQKQSQALANLIQLLLTLARLDHSGARLHMERVELRPVVMKAIEEAGLVHDARILVQVDGDLVCCPEALNQIVRNLVENAAAHTPSDGSIVVSFEGGSLRVSDTGPGISAEHLPRLFDRFFRVDAARGGTGGVGLGLAIVKTLSERQGATVSVSSEMGKGTTFCVNFVKTPETSSEPHV